MKSWMQQRLVSTATWGKSHAACNPECKSLVSNAVVFFSLTQQQRILCNWMDPKTRILQSDWLCCCLNESFLMSCFACLAGLSLKSQELTAIFLAVRLYCSLVMEKDIHTVLDSATLITTLWVIYTMRFKLKSTLVEDLDNLPIYYVVSLHFTPSHNPFLSVWRW
jgi:hypothetical protein